MEFYNKRNICIYTSKIQQTNPTVNHVPCYKYLEMRVWDTGVSSWTSSGKCSVNMGQCGERKQEDALLFKAYVFLDF